jgi:hypothetical protein
VNTGLVIGGPGTGKTTFAARLLAAHRHPRRRFFVSAPWGGFRGVHVRDAAALRKRPTWPPVAVVGGDVLELLGLALEVGSVTVIVDEVQRLFPVHEKHFDKDDPRYKVLEEGRHHRVFLLGLTTSPLEVSYALRKAAYWCYFLRLSDSQELQWVSSRCGARFAAMVAAHTGYAPLFWSPASAASTAELPGEKVPP